MRPITPIHKRFWEKVDIRTEHECWNWKGYKQQSGHGTFRETEKKIHAHRFSYKLHYGDIPKDLQVMHICDNPACVNPKHLKLGTHQDNMYDRDSKNRLAFGERQGTSKLTEEDVKLIRELYSLKIFTQAQLGKMFGVSDSHISYIIRRISWVRTK